MTEYLIRIFLFTVLPLVAATAVVMLDGGIRTRAQKLEIFIIYLFGLGVAGSGIGNAAGHLFLSDLVAESIGWETGSPFQLEMGFANLALGVLGILAASRRDGFREATVTAVTVVAIGATIVHVIDIARTGNLAPGNTVQNVINLLKPALLIGFLVAIRRAGSDGEMADAERGRHLAAVGPMAGLSATGFAVGYAIGQPVIGSVVGVLAGGLAVVLILLLTSRSARRSGGPPRATAEH